MGNIVIAKSYPKIENSDKIIKEKCYEKVHKIYGENLPDNIRERLDLELNSIIKYEYESIYLLFSDMVKKSNELGYEVEVRGGVGNSFVAYLLEITNYNPIDYNLPFEVFAGICYDNELNYCKEPCIELCFSSKIREKIFLYLQEKFGKDKVKFEDIEENIYEKSKEFLLRTFESDTPTLLYELENLTNISSDNIDLKDKEALALFLHANDNSYNNSLKGVPEFGSEFARNLLDIIKPRNFNDLVCTFALLHGTDTWKYNAEDLIKKGIKVDEVISNRADVFNFLLKNGIDRRIAFQITEFIRKGKASRGRSLWQHIRDRYKELNEQWVKYRKIMEEHDIPEWYIKSAEKVEYIFPKSHSIGYTINAFKIAWYKVHYPKAFYEAYFKINPNLNINNYYNKEQVVRDLNRLYDEKEIHEYNKEFDYDEKNDSKIEDLEVLLEMYENGILQDKEKIKDDYNLINSRAIADYCRSIKHQFNTEELAVLVYRNKRMSIEEKIKKYNDLIENYPDMEVIERINCEHYDSVKTMIKNEIERLTTLKEKLEKDEEGAIYSYEMYYTSTNNCDTHRALLDNLNLSFSKIKKEIDEYIKEYDDTLAYKIIKKYLNSDEPTITAEYQVFNQKGILTNIQDSKNNFLDIDNIFLNIPTPFKRGDILVSWGQMPYRKGMKPDDNDIFVLDYLCTWKEGLEEFLKKGNHDSSDMIGYGYYLCYEDNSTEFVCDHKWDYDSFEYYDEELKGNKRILKNISSFLKGKIGLELFVHAYDAYKAENLRRLPDFYTDKGLKLAGFTDEDIQKENHNDDINYNFVKK
jgi:hypothetical protein